MKIDWRAGLLIILLAVPAFLFLFLFFFGENQFDLPYKFPVGKGEEVFENDNASDIKNYELLKVSTGVSPTSDSLYLTLPQAERLSRKRKLMVVYFNEGGQKPSYNQSAELERFSEKIKNQNRVIMLKLYEDDRLTPYWIEFFDYIKNSDKNSYNPDGMLVLVDEYGFYRGVYNPDIKSEIDRLVTEYQIILKF